MQVTHGHTSRKEAFIMSNKKVILSAKDISVEFQVRNRTLRAIRNISVDLHAGETLALVGESGSGKSVFTKVFTGMLETNGSVATGTVTYGDMTLTDLKNKCRMGKNSGRSNLDCLSRPHDITQSD
jgi:oligopeptide transport system ATP-binding protein